MKQMWLWVVGIMGAALLAAKYYISFLTRQRDKARDGKARAEAQVDQAQRREQGKDDLREQQQERRADENERLREGDRDHLDNSW